MTYFSFQVFNDIICNYQRPPRIENNRVSRQLSSLEAESKKKKKYHYHQRYQKINEQKQRYLHLLNKSVSSESQNINKGRRKTLALALKKILLKCPELHHSITVSILK